MCNPNATPGLEVENPLRPGGMLRRLKAMKPGDEVWDVKEDEKGVKGLHARMSRAGTVSLSMYYRTRAGRPRRPKLGEWPALSLADARDRARTMLAQVELGGDPAGEVEGLRDELTLQALWDKVKVAHYDKPRYQASGWGVEAARIWEKEFSKRWGSWKLSELTRKKIKDWHEARGAAHPIQANRALSVLKKMFSWAEEEELRPLHTSPAAKVPEFTERKRRRYATAEEIAKVETILQKEAATRPRQVAFLYLLMYSGARPSVITRAKWTQLEEIEFEGARWGILVLPGKGSADSGEDDPVLLPPQAMAVLDRLPRDTTTLTGMKMHPKAYWERIRKEAGCPDLWVRDWRRTFASIGLSNGIPVDQIGECLGHHDRQTTLTYSKLFPVSRIRATARIAAHLDTARAAGKKEDPDPDPFS